MAATLEQIGAALKAADAAGNVEDARRLAQAYKAMLDQQAPPPSTTPPAGAAPGSREYADWAAAQARAGNALPQVSPPPPSAGFPIMNGPVDKILAGYTGAVNSVPLAGPFLTGGINNVKSALQGVPVADIEAENAERERQNPTETVTGRVAGTVLPFMAAGPLPYIGRALGMAGGIPSRLGFGIASGGLIGAGDTAVRGGDTQDIINSAVRGAGLGLAAPVVGATAGSVVDRFLGRDVPKSVKQVGKALTREGIDETNLVPRMNELGPNGMLADLGPNLTRQASTIASMPGRGQAIVRGRLSERAAGANQRIRDTLDNTLGPSPIPSLEKESIVAAQDALSPYYERALQNAHPTNVRSIVQNVEGNARLLRGEAQQVLQRILPMFNETGTNVLSTSPRVLLEIRKAIDGMFEGDLTKNTRRVLTNVRGRIDNELARTVPGIKQIDAHYEELARQSQALDRGGQVLGSGPEAPWPADLAAEMAGSSRGVQLRLSQGTRALLERIVGNNANDVQALNRLIKGEGDWNRARLATIFGQRRADEIIRAVGNEVTFSKTNNIVQQGPETAARLHGGKELGEVHMDVPAGTTITGAVLRGATKGANAAMNANREAINAQIADLVTRLGITPNQAELLLRGMRPRAPGWIGPAVPGLLTSPNGPIQITIPGMGATGGS